MESQYPKTQRIYIDPERLISLKKQRKSMKLVPSIFQAPQQSTQPTNYQKSSISIPNIIVNNILYDLIQKAKHPNVEYILGLLHQIKIQWILYIQQGDCLNLKVQERWLILQGQLKIVGFQGNSFIASEGSFLFVGSQTKKRLKEIVGLKTSKILRISEKIFENIRNYIFLKNAQKIKFIKYCPFLGWGQNLSEDLATFMQLKVFEKGQNIYNKDQESDILYFVKQGVVFLQRNNSIINPVLLQYENHYQKNIHSDNQVTLIIKRGMIFGVDGLLLKQFFQNSALNQINNKNRSQKRVYNAKALGRTQVYSISKNILQCFFEGSELNSQKNIRKQLSKKDLDRICIQYAQMVARSKSLPKITQNINNLQLNINLQQKQMNQKKEKISKIRMQMKRHSLAPMISKNKKTQDQNQSILLQNQLTQKLGLNQINQTISPLAFPLLNSKLKKKQNQNNKKQNKAEQTQKYIFKWLKSEDPTIHDISRNPQSSNKVSKFNILKVKSYRTIIPIIN